MPLHGSGHAPTTSASSWLPEKPTFHRDKEREREREKTVRRDSFNTTTASSTTASGTLSKKDMKRGVQRAGSANVQEGDGDGVGGDSPLTRAYYKTTRLLEYAIEYLSFSSPEDEKVKKSPSYSEALKFRQRMSLLYLFSAFVLSFSSVFSLHCLFCFLFSFFLW
jgi:hypothetical protein